jgi:DDE superfamily endonuclease
MPTRYAYIVREYALETLGDEDAVLIVDETGFLKQGKASCGVARQYTGVNPRPKFWTPNDTPRRPSRTMRIFSSAEYCFRVSHGR